MTMEANSEETSDSFSGDLGQMAVPELLARALAEKFTGSLVLKTQEGVRAGVYFERGAPARARAPLGERAARPQRALESQLPPEQIAFAEAHASKQGCDLFSAVEQLRLLPTEVVVGVHSNYLRQQLVSLCSLPDATMYRLFPERNCFDNCPGLSHPIEPMTAIVECIDSYQDVGRFREAIAPHRHSPIVLAERLGVPDHQLRGVLRGVVTRLRRQPDSFEQLRLCRVASEQSLIAAVFALRAGGRIIQRAAPSTSDTLRTSEAPRATQAPRVNERPRLSEAPRFSQRVSRRESQGPRSSHVSTDSFRAVGAGSRGRPTVMTSAPPSSRRMERFNVNRDTAKAKSSISQTMPGVDSTPAGPTEHQVEARALHAWTCTIDEPRKLPRALTATENAAELFPDNARILFYRASVLSLSGDRGAALQLLKRVLMLDPGHTEAAAELRRLKTKASGEQRTSTSFFERLRSRASG